MKNKYVNLLDYLILVTHIGWLMALSIFSGFGIGYFIYYHIYNSVIIFIIFILLGITAGFINVYRLIYKKLKTDAQADPDYY